MIYFVCAFIQEARPLIAHYGLKRDEAFPWPLYAGGEAVVVVSGMGMDAAKMATAALLGRRHPSGKDLLVNVGICAAPPEYPVGTLLLAEHLQYGTWHRYPDIRFSPACRTAALRSVDRPVHAPLPQAADMEAFGIFQAGERFLRKEQMLFFKIVSDHFEPKRVSKAAISSLIGEQTKRILSMLGDAQSALESD